jgi:hypothetical protein
MQRRAIFQRAANEHDGHEHDGHDHAERIIRADDAFAERLRAAIAAGEESASSASASVIKPDKPWRPRRISALDNGERSYYGSSAAWAASSD